uniref:Uncharacterized protein n=1 Tax=Megaselia scalaris TaxID=36166 RepID=T1GH04_MEGSC
MVLGFSKRSSTNIISLKAAYLSFALDIASVILVSIFGDGHNSKNWKRPGSATETERRRNLGQTPTGSDGEKDKRYNSLASLSSRSNYYYFDTGIVVPSYLITQVNETTHYFDVVTTHVDNCEMCDRLGDLLLVIVVLYEPDVAVDCCCCKVEVFDAC